MRTFARKKRPQKPTSSSTTRPNKTTPGPAQRLLHLQRTIGNQAVQRMLKTYAEKREPGLTAPASLRVEHDSSRIPGHDPAAQSLQTKLAISTPGDEYEQEADRISEQVMATPTHHAASGAPLHIQRVAEQPIGPAEAVPASVNQTLATSGRPLEPALRQDMEQRFGHDFSGVRLHTGEAAEQSAQDVNAQAYTVGQDIVFGAGRFAPAVHEGRRLLAHELTHVVQQHKHHPRVQRQQSATLLTPAAATAAVADVTSRYDEDSIRMLEAFARQPSDGVFDTADAEAIAKFQQTFRLTPNGKADVALLDVFLQIARPIPAQRSALIHLVIDHANLDVSGVLAVVYDPSLTAASDIRTLPGGVSTILIGDQGFASYRVMVAEIRRRLSATPTASPVTAVPPAVFTDTFFQNTAILINNLRINDPRSIRLLQGALGSKATGKWDVDLVRHVAAKQQTLGSFPSGTLDEGTFAAVAAEMIARGSHDGVLQLIVDYYNLDRSHMFDIVFDPNQPPGHPTAQAETSRGAGGFNIPGVVRVFPFGFAQPFSSLVHTVAHEIEHIHQVMQGIASEPVREFLSEGIEIESIGMPTEAIESDADIDLIVRDKLPVNPGFLKDADRMLHFWGQMTPAEKQTHHQRFKDIRSIIVSRIATEASASQQRKLATFVRNFQAADAGVP